MTYEKSVNHACGSRIPSFRNLLLPLLRYRETVKELDLQVNDSSAHANGNGLRAVRSPELFHNVFDVNLDGLLGYK